MMTLTLTPHVPDPTEVEVDENGYRVPVYEPQDPHPGKVQSSSGRGADSPTRYVSIGGVERPVIEGGLHIPLDAPIPVASEQRGQGWEYLVTAVGAPADAALLDRRYLVVEVPAKSFATARRLDVVEL